MATSTALRHRLLARARIRHLQVLLCVADVGSVKGAADLMGLSQPALTHILLDLEELLECQLFLRHSRGMRTTAVGQALLPLARRILSAVDESAERVVAVTGNASSVVRVAAVTSAITGLLVRMVPEFCRAYPDVLIHLIEADVAQQAALIERAEVDAVLCRAPAVTPNGWAFTPLLSDRLAIVGGNQHPLAGAERVDMESLLRFTWLLTPAPTAARLAFDKLFDGRANVKSLVMRSQSLIWRMLLEEPLLLLGPYSFVRQFIAEGQFAEISTAVELEALDPIGLLRPTSGGGAASDLFAESLVAFATSKESA